jgi:hypothetical protein
VAAGVGDAEADAEADADVEGAVDPPGEPVADPLAEVVDPGATAPPDVDPARGLAVPLSAAPAVAGNCDAVQV